MDACLSETTHKVFMGAMKANFSRWYANGVKEALDQGINIQDLKVDLKATVVKPLHANWLMMSISSLKSKSDIIKRGFEKNGILEYSTTS